MTKPTTTIGTLLLAAILSTQAFAQDNRELLLRRLIAAQGLEQTFEIQLEAQRQVAETQAKEMFDDMVRQTGGKPTPSIRAVFARFNSKIHLLLSSKELTSAWMSHYGKNLTTHDLTEIVRFYESPVGQKDVAATKAAMGTFSEWVTKEGYSRMSILISDFAQELKAVQPNHRPKH